MTGSLRTRTRTQYQFIEASDTFEVRLHRAYTIATRKVSQASIPSLAELHFLSKYIYVYIASSSFTYIALPHYSRTMAHFVLLLPRAPSMLPLACAYHTLRDSSLPVRAVPFHLSSFPPHSLSSHCNSIHWPDSDLGLFHMAVNPSTLAKLSHTMIATTRMAKDRQSTLSLLPRYGTVPGVLIFGLFASISASDTMACSAILAPTPLLVVSFSMFQVCLSSQEPISGGNRS